MNGSSCMSSILGLTKRSTNSTLRVSFKIDLNSIRVKTAKGDRIEVHYVGTLYKNGKEFDSSISR